MGRKPDELVGETLADRYLLEERIGDGGMSHVYRGLHTGIGARIAVKVLPRTGGDEGRDRAAARFQNEARVTATLTHPNTVRVLDYGAEPDLLFLVMENIAGVDLSRLLGRQHRELLVAHVLWQVAGSLSEAHGRGLVHRDIKPSNLMLARYAGFPCFVKVIDFGIARAVAGPGHGTQGILGTMCYAAPEQARDQPKLDARTDLYSLGCVAYELLTGRLPYPGLHHSSPLIACLQAHLRGTATPIGEARPGVDRQLGELVMTMLSRDPDGRPRDAEALITPLRAVAARLSHDGVELYDEVTSQLEAHPSWDATTDNPQPARPSTEGWVSPGAVWLGGGSSSREAFAPTLDSAEHTPPDAMPNTAEDVRETAEDSMASTLDGGPPAMTIPFETLTATDLEAKRIAPAPRTERVDAPAEPAKTVPLQLSKLPIPPRVKQRSSPPAPEDRTLALERPIVEHVRAPMPSNEGPRLPARQNPRSGAVSSALNPHADRSDKWAAALVVLLLVGIAAGLWLVFGVE